MGGHLLHAVKRGLQHRDTVSLLKRVTGGDGDNKIEIPTWGVAIMALTFVSFFVFVNALEYTLKDVIATLAMVETPAAAITVSHSEQEADVKEGLLETGPTITLVHQKPITSSIRGTIQHLVSQAGRLARWRGLLPYIFYHVLFMVVANLFDTIIPRFPGHNVLISGAAGALLSNYHAAWTHKVISMPSDKSFRARIMNVSAMRQLWLPAFVKASVVFVSMYITQGFVILLNLHNVNKSELSSAWISVVLRIVSIIAVMLATVLFIVLPATVTLIRVEASMLPEEEDTIIPFDRTFGGKVVPRVLGGTGAIGFVDAWRLFNWEARRRLMKHYAKFFAIVTAVVLVFVHVIALELWAIMGPSVGKFLAQAKQNM